MNLIVSYNHSGDFWVRYMVEYSTKLPTTGPGIEDKPIGEVYPIGVDLRKEPILHSKREIEASDIGIGNKAIFLVRNYRDVFVRKSFSKDEIDNSFYQRTYLDEGYDKYMSVLRAYEDWDGEKMLVYYEDLVGEPDDSIIEIFKFLDFSDDLAKSIIDNYEQNYRCCMGIFRRTYPGSDLTAFPESISSDAKLHMNDIMMYNSPFLFGKYLSRYIG